MNTCILLCAEEALLSLSPRPGTVHWESTSIKVLPRHAYKPFIRKKNKKSISESLSHTSHLISENPNGSNFKVHSQPTTLHSLHQYHLAPSLHKASDLDYFCDFLVTLWIFFVPTLLICHTIVRMRVVKQRHIYNSQKL